MNTIRSGRAASIVLIGIFLLGFSAAEAAITRKQIRAIVRQELTKLLPAQVQGPAGPAGPQGPQGPPGMEAGAPQLRFAAITQSGELVPELSRGISQENVRLDEFQVPANPDISLTSFCITGLPQVNGGQATISPDQGFVEDVFLQLNRFDEACPVRIISSQEAGNSTATYLILVY